MSRSIARFLLLSFDRITASCAFCVSKGSGSVREIIILRVERHFARKSVRPFDIKTASCAFCLSKGSGFFSGIIILRIERHFARNLSRPFDAKTASCAICVSKGEGHPYNLTAAIRRKRAFNSARCVLIAVAAALIASGLGLRHLICQTYILSPASKAGCPRGRCADIRQRSLDSDCAATVPRPSI